jgi:hypothetical protein
MEACPKSIDVKFIAEMNRAFAVASLRQTHDTEDGGGVG